MPKRNDELRSRIARLGTQREIAGRIINPATGQPVSLSYVTHWLQGIRRVPDWALQQLAQMERERG